MVVKWVRRVAGIVVIIVITLAGLELVRSFNTLLIFHAQYFDKAFQRRLRIIRE